MQVAVIASGAKQSRLRHLYLDCFVYFDKLSYHTSTSSVTASQWRGYEFRHYKRRAWEKSLAKKSDDDTGRRHCERSEAIQIESLVSGLLRASQWRGYDVRHYKRRAWEESPAKKSDDDAGRRHCDCEARSRKQSRDSDSVRINDFVIIRAVDLSNPLIPYTLDCFLLRVLRHFDGSTGSPTASSMTASSVTTSQSQWRENGVSRSLHFLFPATYHVT